jgi:hypothetical protein
MQIKSSNWSHPKCHFEGDVSVRDLLPEFADTTTNELVRIDKKQALCPSPE